MPKEICIKAFSPHPGQRRLLDNFKRFNVIPCARRFGKTDMFHNLGYDSLLFPSISSRFRTSIFVKDSKAFDRVWNELCINYEKLIRRKDGTKLILDFKSGGSIVVYSIGNDGRKDNGRGPANNRVIYEETQDIPDDILDYHWNNVARPTLATTGGDAFFVGTPNGKGSYFHKLVLRGAKNGKIETNPGDELPEGFDDWITFEAATEENPLVPLSEIRNAEMETDTLTFLQEYKGKFVDYAGNPWCYVLKMPEVSRKVFVRGLNTNWAMPVYISFDFNKQPMSAVLGQFYPTNDPKSLWKTGLHAIREFTTNPDVQSSVYDMAMLIREYVYSMAGQKIGKWYDGYDQSGNPKVKEQYPCRLPIFITGDASGDVSSGIQSVPKTYYEILCDELGLNFGLQVRLNNSNPPHAESYVKVNSALQHNPQMRVDVDQCPKLYRDMLQVKADKQRGIDKTKADLTHHLDGYRYMIDMFLQ